MTSTEFVRPTHVIINLSRLQRNLEAIRAHVEGAQVMPIVKANAYGHGLDEVARFLAPQVDYIGVAVLGEGVHRRAFGTPTPLPGVGGPWCGPRPLYLQSHLTI